VYAFSIENFKRSKSEVEALMKLAEEKLTELMDSYTLICCYLIFRDLITKHEVCFRLVGDISLLPPKVQLAMAKLIQKSSSYSKFAFLFQNLKSSAESLIFASLILREERCLALLKLYLKEYRPDILNPGYPNFSS
jgi:undecaprenyl diphosphate synthase